MIDLIVMASFGGACLLVGWKIGRYERPDWVENTQRAHNENARYFKVRGEVDVGDGEQWHIMLFTEGEVVRGISRAESHPEDLL